METKMQDLKYPIQRDVPMPTVRKPGRQPVYPFHLLERGEMFFVPGSDMKKFSANITRMNKRWPGRRFRGAGITQEGVSGVGVWRVK